jgi:hypothetical protein
LHSPALSNPPLPHTHRRTGDSPPRHCRPSGAPCRRRTSLGLPSSLLAARVACTKTRRLGTLLPPLDQATRSSPPPEHRRFDLRHHRFPIAQAVSN